MGLDMTLYRMPRYKQKKNILVSLPHRDIYLNSTGYKQYNIKGE